MPNKRQNLFTFQVSFTIFPKTNVDQPNNITQALHILWLEIYEHLSMAPRTYHLISPSTGGTSPECITSKMTDE